MCAFERSEKGMDFIMKDLIKKWWFWVITEIVILMISSTIIICMGYSIVKGEVENLAKEIQGIYSEATLYSSSGMNSLTLELLNYDNERDSKKQEEIINIIKAKKSNGELKEFNKLITLSYITSNGKTNQLLMKTIINLDEFTVESQEAYIVYKEYEELFDKYNEAMSSYTKLFNSIY